MEGSGQDERTAVAAGGFTSGGVLLILMPAAFFLSVPSPDATKPNAMISLAYLGAVLLTVGLLTLGMGLVRSR